jgi:glycyl-tRNA synthetase
MAKQEDIFNVISHAKEYGFIFPSSEIYDGLSAVYDYAQNGEQKRTYGNIGGSHGSNE